MVLGARWGPDVAPSRGPPRCIYRDREAEGCGERRAHARGVPHTRGGRGVTGEGYVYVRRWTRSVRLGPLAVAHTYTSVCVHGGAPHTLVAARVCGAKHV